MTLDDAKRIMRVTREQVFGMSVEELEKMASQLGELAADGTLSIWHAQAMLAPAEIQYRKNGIHY